MPHRDDFERVCLCVHIIYRWLTSSQDCPVIVFNS
jgi:hypothetical protein